VKLLYAASNNINSRIVLSRTYPYIKERGQLKIAAYRKSSPENIPIDWTLDCLYNILFPETLSADNNENISIYYDQIKHYSPDLIISDLEWTTSSIGISLNIPVIQYSSLLSNNAIIEIDKAPIFKKFSYLTNRDPEHTAMAFNIITNSECNFFYSHIGDIETPPTLKDNIKWIRPYSKIGKEGERRKIVSYQEVLNKKALSYIKRYNSIIYSSFTDESYKNIQLKKVSDEYYDDLFNCSMFVSSGQESLLADAYYNNKYAVIIPDFTDAECIISSMFDEKYKLGNIIYDRKELPNFFGRKVISEKKENIFQLHDFLDNM
jgi:hypothetical protein